jgi:hypothetical protein
MLNKGIFTIICLLALQFVNAQTGKITGKILDGEYNDVLPFANVLVKDTQQIFAGGKRVILRCLLQIQKILDKSEFHYLFNKLYICPYMSWIQRMRDQDILIFSIRLCKCVSTEMVTSKASLDLNLETYEEKLWSEIEEESSVDSEEDSDESEEASSDSSHSDCETNRRASRILLDTELDNVNPLEISKMSSTEEDTNANDTITLKDHELPKKTLIEELP